MLQSIQIHKFLGLDFVTTSSRRSNHQSSSNGCWDQGSHKRSQTNSRLIYLFDEHIWRRIREELISSIRSNFCRGFLPLQFFQKKNIRSNTRTMSSYIIMYRLVIILKPPMDIPIFLYKNHIQKPMQNNVYAPIFADTSSNIQQAYTSAWEHVRMLMNNLGRTNMRGRWTKQIYIQFISLVMAPCHR